MARGAQGLPPAPPAPPRADAEAAQQTILARWTQDFRKAVEIARLPRDQRAAQARTLPAVFPGKEVPVGNLDLLAALKPAEIEALLKGAFVSVNGKVLTPEADEGLRLGLSDGGMSTKGKTYEPGFLIQWDSQTTAPMLMLRNQNGVEGNVVGGWVWDTAWLQEVSGDWKTRLDPEATAYRRLRVERPVEAGARTPDTTLPEWLKQVHEKQHLNVIADGVLPRGRNTSGAAWLGLRAEQTVLAIILSADVTGKQSGQIHLFRDKTAVVHPHPHLVPWSEIRALRKAADANDGFLDFPQLARLTELHPEQLRALSEEFPDARPTQAGDWRPMLQFYGALTPTMQKQVRTSEGLLLFNTGLIARAVLTSAPDPKSVLNLKALQEQGNQARVSLRIEPRQRRNAGGKISMARQLVWDILGPDGVKHRRIYMMGQRQPLKPE